MAPSEGIRSIGVKDTSTKATPKKRAFIEGLRKHGTVYHAARAARIDRGTAYKWKKTDEKFSREWADAYRDCIEIAEDSLYSRGLAGDNTAMIFWLKGADPEKYKDRVQQERKEEHRHTHTHKLDVSTLDDDDKRSLCDLIAKGRTRA